MFNKKSVQQEPIRFQFMEDAANINEFIVIDASEFFDMEASFQDMRHECRKALSRVRAGTACPSEFAIAWMGYRFAAKAYFKAYGETMKHYEEHLD